MLLQSGARSDACDAIVDLIDVGSGTAQCTLCESDDTVLSTHNLNNPFSGAASNGVATLNTISDATAGATGTAAKLRFYDRDAALIFEMSVGTGSEDVVISSTAVSSGVTISIEGGDGGGTITVPAGSV